MQRTFIIAIMLLSITTAHAQTGVQFSDQTGAGSDPLSVPTSSLSGSGTTGGSATTSGQTGVGSDPLNVPTSSSPSVSSPSSGSGSGTSGGSATTIGSAGAGAGAITTSGSTGSQTAITTAAAPAPPICPPPVPSSDGGSANLSFIAGVSINGC
jgi:hypothetical protein